MELQIMQVSPSSCYFLNRFKYNGIYSYVPPALTINNCAFRICGFCMVLTVNRDYFLKQH
jgi:hypothetical protein